MTNATTLLTCASWEDRFRLGLERTLSQVRVRLAFMYYYDDFDKWTKPNREAAKSLFAKSGVEVVERQLRVDCAASNWRRLQEDVDQLTPDVRHALVDISTMPRELIWTTFWSLDAIKARTSYTYHSPAHYHDDWLSRDPGRPRLVLKLSGVSRLDRRTALIVSTGYDSQRSAQLMRFYEPEVTLVGLQVGDVNKGNLGRMLQQREEFARFSSARCFELDAFAPDHGQQSLHDAAWPFLSSHNVIMSSLGPKLSAVSIYRLTRKHPEIGIAYAPSREFNRDYSSGLGATFGGSL